MYKGHLFKVSLIVQCSVIILRVHRETKGTIGTKVTILKHKIYNDIAEL